MLDPKMLSLSIVGILNTLIKNKANQIMIDGKAIKSTDAIKSITTMMNIVTAYTDTGIALGQVVVDNKSNEIPAVRELIELLNVKGMIITADAMHCQREIAETIIRNKGNYVLQLKANQGTFYKDVYAMFDDKYMDIADRDNEYETFTTLEKGHGRIEKKNMLCIKGYRIFYGLFSRMERAKENICSKKRSRKR